MYENAAVHKGSGKIRRRSGCGPEKSWDVSRRNVGGGKIANDRRYFRRRRSGCRLHKGDRSGFSVRSRKGNVGTGRHHGIRFVCGESVFKAGRNPSESFRNAAKRNAELIRIQFEFREIGLARRIIRSRRVPSSAGKGDARSINERHSSGKGIVRIMDDVVSGRISRNRRFRSNSGLH